MTRTVKLSETFYQKFGHESTDELLDLLNEMNTSNHVALREINELNFARFDAKLEQRIAEVRGDMQSLDSRSVARSTALESSIDRRFAEMTAYIERRFGEQTRWLYISWATLMAAIIAVWFHQA